MSWGASSRHLASVCGGCDAERIDAFVRAVAQAADDEEWKQRGKDRHTHAQVAAGAKVTGGPKLAELLGGGHRAMGQAIAAKVREWLGLPLGLSIDGPALRTPIARVAAFGAVAALGGDEDAPLCAVDTFTPLPVVTVFGVRFQGGMLVVLDGDPSLGKTLLALADDLGETRGGKVVEHDAPLNCADDPRWAWPHAPWPIHHDTRLPLELNSRECAFRPIRPELPTLVWWGRGRVIGNYPRVSIAGHLPITYLTHGDHPPH